MPRILTDTGMDEMMQAPGGPLERIGNLEASATSMLDRMNEVDTGPGSLAARITSAEITISEHASSISSLENRAGDLEAWRGNKADAIANLGTAPTASTVDVLGIQVPTGSSYTALVAYVGTMKTKIDTVLAALRTREILAVS